VRPFSVINSFANTTQAKRHVIVFNSDDSIDQSTGQASKSSYTAPAREGAYGILKIGEESRHWCSTQNTAGIACSNTATAPAEVSNVTLTNTYMTQRTPPLLVGNPTYYSGSAWVEGNAYQMPFTDRCMQVDFSQISSTASIVFNFRLGVEVICKPGQILYQVANFGSELDSRVLEIHDTAWRYFMDAYPSSFNSRGDFYKILSKILRTTSKIVEPLAGALLPVSMPLASAARPLMLKAADSLLMKSQKEKSKSSNSRPTGREALENRVKQTAPLPKVKLS